MEKSKTAILFTTHFFNDKIKNQIVKLRDDMIGLADIFVLYQSEQFTMPEIEGVSMFPFTIDDLNTMEYRSWGNTIMDGNFHFIILYFFRHHPDYNYYWPIEYDVRFNGKWNTFFSFFDNKDEDFVAAHIEKMEDNPHWMRWNEIELIGKVLSDEEKLRSFNPIYRLSNNALSLLDAKCIKGDRGHNEILIPTEMQLEGMTIADFGGCGRFIYKGFPNLFYTDDIMDDETYKCTFRFRPNHSESKMRINNMLYHPVK